MANLVADARALSAGQYQHLVVYGSAAIGDGGGGLYVWNAAATNVDDGVNWIKPDSVTHPDPGRWERVWAASGNITTFGRDLIDSADAAAARTTLELGTMAVEAAASFINVVGTPTTGNFPVLTAAGELNNSTYSNASFATSAQGSLADTALQPEDVGTIASQSSSSVSITGGSITGITDIAIADGGTGASTAADAFANLKQAATTAATGVVELATDGETASGVVVQGNDSRLHAAVTLAGTPDYITISGQEITRAQIDLAADVTGLLPPANVAGLATATETGTTRTNTASDRNQFVRWTNTAAKTFTVENSIAAAADTWQGINAGATGNLTLAPGSGVTLTGNLIFAPLKTYTLRFTAASAADVIGGSTT